MSDPIQSACAVLCRKAWAKVQFNKVRYDPNVTPEQWREAYTEFRAASRQVKKMDDAERAAGTWDNPEEIDRQINLILA